MSHLTLKERMKIELDLNTGIKISVIALSLGKSKSTIKREIEKHILITEKNPKGRLKNRCIHRRDCTFQFVCSTCQNPLTKNKLCRYCGKCNDNCQAFEELICPNLSKSPYVCNGCKEFHICVLRKRIYSAEYAQNSYKEKLCSSRQGFAMSETDRAAMSEILRNGMTRQQSVHHINAAHADDFKCCEKTLYNYINKGALATARRPQLPRAPFMKPRKKDQTAHRIDPHCREGRSYENFLEFHGLNPSMEVVEMDSVLGVQGGNVLLTLNFNSCGLMLAFIRERNTSQSVIDIFDELESEFGLSVFRRLFPIILTDNGSEFSNPSRLETSPAKGESRTRIFYCNPYAPAQKAHVENNHINLRNIFHKGAPIPMLESKTMGRALSHLNSMFRAGYGNIPAIEKFEKLYGKEILPKLGIHLIPGDEVTLTPEIIRE